MLPRNEPRRRIGKALLRLGLLLGAGVLLRPPFATAENIGQAEIAFQGYYLGGSSRRVNDISGVALHFRQFLPRLGLLSGSLENYGGDGRFQTGDNYLQLRGLPWAGLRWTFTGGDFRTSLNQVDFPFYNIFYPEVTARGVHIEASRQGRRYSVFYGEETLQEGPRVPFRVRAPQSIAGVSAQQRWKRLQLGARLLQLWSSPHSITANSFFFPPNREFLRVKNGAAQALYSLGDHLRFYGEASASSARVPAGSRGVSEPSLSAVTGAVWESRPFSARVNYSHQGPAYLPVIGYFLGDRRGPFAEMRYRPWERLEVFGSASRYSNNLGRDAELPTFRSTGASSGASIRFPWKLTATTQLSSIRFSVQSPDVAAPRESDNRQLIVSLGRPIRRHTVRVAARDLKLRSNFRVERQRSAEVEDVFQLKRVVLGAAVRGQRLAAEQRRNTLFVRGFAQLRLGRLSAHATVENGADLVNRTVFATNTFSTTVAGLNVRLGRAWHVQAEAFRNRLTMELNPESIFVLENRGVGLSSVLSGFNQWSFFFRLTKQLHWGGPIPAGGLDQYATQQIPLTGTVEGLVWEQAISGRRPAAGVPVSLDHSRTVATDASGRYRFAEVPEGPHQITLAARQLPTHYDPGPTPEAVAVVKPRQVARLDLSVLPLASLQGRVAGPAGAALENIVIRLLPLGRYTTSDAEGNFAFHNLQEGDYQIVLEERSLAERSRLSSPDTVQVSIRQGSVPPSPHFDLILLPAPEKPVRRVLEL